MDSDGQHRAEDVLVAIDKLRNENCDVVSGSRFLGEATIQGLSKRRRGGSSFANKLARKSLPNEYINLTDYMTGCMVMNMGKCLHYIRKVDLNGFLLIHWKGTVTIHWSSLSFLILMPERNPIGKFQKR